MFYEVFMNQAEALYLEKRYDEALAALQQAISHAPDELMPYFFRGLVYHEKDFLDHAMADFSYVIEENPDFPGAYRGRATTHAAKGDYGLAIADINTAMRLAPKKAPLDYFHRGRWCDRQGNLDEAIADYGKAIKLDPKFAAAFLMRANAYCEIEKFDLAIADYTRAIALEPQDTETYFYRHLAYRDKKNYHAAISDLSKILELEPGHEDALHARADLHAKSGDHALAIADYDADISRDPENYHIYRERADSYAALGDHAHAIADYGKFLEVATQRGDSKHMHETIYRDRAASYAALGAHDLAIADLTTFIELGETDRTNEFQTRMTELAEGGNDGMEPLLAAPMQAMAKATQGTDFAAAFAAMVGEGNQYRNIEAYRLRAASHRAKGDETAAAADTAKATELEVLVEERDRARRAAKNKRDH